MTTKCISMAAAAIIATALGATIAFAQGNPPPAAQQAPAHQGMMMDRGGVMDTQMNRMMENCNQMMEGMRSSPSGASKPTPDHG